MSAALSALVVGFRFVDSGVDVFGAGLEGVCFLPGGSTSGSAELGGSSGLTSGIRGGEFSMLS